MKLLKTIIHPDFPTPNAGTVNREAARIVLIDEDGNFPLIYASKYDIYCIPGGGIDEGESILDALKRETKEETGCEIEILGEIGKVVEKRCAEGYKLGLNMIQTSYCYYGKVLSKGEAQFTQSEKARGFQLRWFPHERVLQEITNTSPTIFKAKLVTERDIMIFREGYKKLRHIEVRNS